MAVQEEGELETEFQTKLCRLDLLKPRWLRDQTVMEAVAADVIIVSLHGDQDLPQEMRDCFNLWLERKHNRPYVIAVLLDAEQANECHIRSVTSFLQTVAIDGAADLLWGFCEKAATAQPNAAPTDGSTRMALEPNTNLHYAGSYSHWGINE